MTAVQLECIFLISHLKKSAVFLPIKLFGRLFSTFCFRIFCHLGNVLVIETNENLMSMEDVEETPILMILQKS